MTAEELKTKYVKITGLAAVDEHGKITQTYINWLESLVLASDQRERDAFEAGREGQYEILPTGKRQMDWEYPSYEQYKNRKP